MNFEKLKETARKFEQKEDWRRAIEVYREAIRKFEAGDDPAPDLSVYNRLGDLYLKANDSGSAVQAYERAVDLYSEQGFYNNAIALCGKILRVNPGRVQVYLKLASLHAHKNVVIEVKKNLLEYLERMNALHHLDDAFKSLKEFADQFPGNKDIRMMLVELLKASSRHAEARAELERLTADLEARGDAVGARKTLQQLQAMDDDGSQGGAGVRAAPSPAAPAATPSPRPQRPGDLVFLDTGVDEEPPAKAPPPPPRKTEPVRPPAAPPPQRPAASRPAPPPPAPPPAGGPSIRRPGGHDPVGEEDGGAGLDLLPPLSEEAKLEGQGADTTPALGFEPTHLGGGMGGHRVAPLEGLDTGHGGGDGGGLGITHGTEGYGFGEDSGQAAELLGGGGGGEYSLPGDAGFSLSGGVSELGTGSESGLWDSELGAGGIEEGGGVEATIAALEDRVLEDPDDPEAHRALGEALLAAGESLRGQEELELAMAGYEQREDWDRCSDLLAELVRLDPNGVRYHQKRVEISYHSGDRARLIDAYLDLADSLLRVGTMDKALAVYRRVADHDPGNRRALAALDALAPPEEIPAPAPPPPQPKRPATSGLPSAGPPPRVAPPPRAEPPAEAPPPRLAPAPAPAPAPKAPAAPPPPRQEPASPAPVRGGDFVDLGSFVLDGGRAKDTRMRVESEEPTGDEQKDFQSMLQQFKRGIEENIDADDFESHYDLGVAFKEMGLLDEAIAEFQKALRSPKGRLKTSEALGTSFFEKGQFAIAETILHRAVETLGAGDEEQIGLIYWLGRARESQAKVDLAVASYQRVMAVDIGFQDTSQRVAKLTARRAR